MLHLATLLPTPHGVKITDEATLWHRVVQPFLETLGYAAEQWAVAPELADGPDGRPLHILIHHAPPSSVSSPDMLLVIESRRALPGDLLDRAIGRARLLPVQPPLIALVHPQRSGFVLTAFHAATRMPLGVAFPSPVALKSLATGLRRMSEAELARRTTPGDLLAELVQARLHDDEPRIVELLRALSREYQLEGRYADADRTLSELLEIHRRAGPPEEVPRVGRELGQVKYLLEQWDEAEAQLMEALEDFRAHGDRAAVAATLVDLGGVHLARNAYDAANIILQESLSICRELNDTAAEGAALNNLAHVYLAVGDVDGAAHCLEQSLETARALGETREELITLYNLAVVYQMLGREALANRMIREVRKLGDALNPPPLERG